METKLDKHIFNFGNKNSGGEIMLTSEIYDNGDKDENSIYLIQNLTLHSCGDSATLNISCFTPDILRKLANELDERISKAKANR